MSKRKLNCKYGLTDISLSEYKNIGMADMLDDLIHGFDDHKAIENVSNQHRQALLDALVLTRNGFARKAGLKAKPHKPYKRKFL